MLAALKHKNKAEGVSFTIDSRLMCSRESNYRIARQSEASSRSQTSEDHSHSQGCR